jgi:tetratricopeptide (TPR) repeat protein
MKQYLLPFAAFLLLQTGFVFAGGKKESPVPPVSESLNLNQAIEDYTETLRLNPNDARAYINRGLVYYEKGDYDQAVADYNQAIRLAPNDAYAYYRRGFAYYDKKDYDKALAVYRGDPAEPQ